MTDRIILSDIDWENVDTDPLKATEGCTPIPIRQDGKDRWKMRIAFQHPVIKICLVVLAFVCVIGLLMGMTTVIKGIEQGTIEPFDIKTLSKMVVCLIVLTVGPLLLRLIGRIR